eukprot:360299-Chlamydomonas_euryale.AAC.6
MRWVGGEESVRGADATSCAPRQRFLGVGSGSPTRAARKKSCRGTNEHPRRCSNTRACAVCVGGTGSDTDRLLGAARLSSGCLPGATNGAPTPRGTRAFLASTFACLASSDRVRSNPCRLSLGEPTSRSRGRAAWPGCCVDGSSTCAGRPRMVHALTL